MKLNEYLDSVYGLSHSEFDILPNDIKKLIREEHVLYLDLINKSKYSKRLILKYLESKGWYEDIDGDMYNRNLK